MYADPSLHLPLAATGTICYSFDDYTRYTSIWLLADKKSENLHLRVPIISGPS